MPQRTFHVEIQVPSVYFEQQFFVWELDNLALHLKCQGYTSFMARLRASQLHVHPALRDSGHCSFEKARAWVIKSSPLKTCIMCSHPSQTALHGRNINTVTTKL